MTRETKIPSKLFIKLISVVGVPFTLIFFLIFLVVVVTPLLIYRFLIQSIRKWVRPTSGRLLSPLSAFFAADKMYSEHPCSTNLICIILEGIVDASTVRQALIDNVLSKKSSNGQLAYPELSMYVTRWGGLSFWEPDTSFSVDNHFRQVQFPGREGQPVTEELYVPMLKNLLRLPFERRRSPWEIILCQNYKDKKDETETPKTLLTYRLHHALCGGYSSMNLILDHGAIKVSRALPAYPTVPTWKKIVWHLVYIVRAPYQLVFDSLNSFDFNQWKLPASKLHKTKSAATSPKISVQSIKDIKNAHQTSFSAVISAAIAGGVRSYMLQNGFKVPSKISVMTPWPVKMIPEKLGNFMSGVIIDYPIGLRDSKKRLMEIQKNFIGMKFSTLPTVYFNLLKIMGRLPHFLLSPARQRLPTSTVMSNIAGPNERLVCINYPITDMAFVSNFMTENIGFGFTVLSYNGYLKIVCGADTTIIPTDDKAEELMDKILAEFEILRNEAIV